MATAFLCRFVALLQASQILTALCLGMSKGSLRMLLVRLIVTVTITITVLSNITSVDVCVYV